MVDMRKLRGSKFLPDGISASAVPVFSNSSAVVLAALP
jgi:hypothetical protein